MSATLKPGISKAKRMLMHSRKPIQVLINLQQERVDHLTARIGNLMSQRVTEEETLAELIHISNGGT